MPTPDRLAEAVRAGIITDEQAARITALDMPAVADAAPVYDPEDEAVHFVRGFQDVFVTIGIALLLAGTVIGGRFLLSDVDGLLIGAVLAFGLATYFVRRRRLVLPGIALAFAFTLFSGLAALVFFSGDAFAGISPNGGAIPFMAGGLASLAASLVFLAVFRLPFALALVAGSVLPAACGAIALFMDDNGVAIALVYTPLVVGLLAFFSAMRFDLADPLRRTLKADEAFWLHLAAAPMIVHSLVALLAPVRGAYSFSLGQSFAIIGIVLLLGIVALIIDRRALLVAGLGYLGFATYRLLSAAPLSESTLFATTLIFVGAAVVLLGAGWRPIRAALLRLVPENTRRHLPPVILA